MSIELNKDEHGSYTAERLDTALLCLIVAANSLGINVTEEELRKKNDLGKDTLLGTEELLTIGKKQLKLKMKQLSPAITELSSYPIPGIVTWHNGEYAILGRNDEKQVLIFDPHQRKMRSILMEDFVQHWTGILITIERPFSFRYLAQKYNMAWFIPAILRYKKYLGEAIIASFFLQLFGLVTPLITQVIIDKVLPNKGTATLDVLVLLLLGSGSFQMILTILRTYLFTHTTNKIDVILGTRVFRHIAALPLRYFENRRVGDTLMRVAAMNGIRDFLTGSVLTSFLDVFFSIVFILVMFYYSVPLTCLALSVVPLYFLQNLFSTPIYKERLQAVWSSGAESNAFLVEAITGIQTMKSLALEPQFNHKWEKLLSSYIGSTFQNTAFTIGISNTGNLIQLLSGFSILWFGGHMVMDGKLTIGQLIAFQMLANQANAPLLRLSGLWQSCQQAKLSLERLSDILNTPPEKNNPTNKTEIPAPLQGQISFDQVFFRYHDRSPQILKNINLHIKPGMRVGIVGRSGSGKSTLAKLIQRLYLPESGRLLFDGRDINSLDPIWLRQQIGVVMQESYLFNGSVRDNIATTRPSTPIEVIIQAAQAAGAHEFILELPEGYDTKVGERGASLSGGQRQRIAIARALLTNPRILIFDEATSALDYHSEQIIMQNLEKLAHERTLLMIAHRLSTVRRCDLILVLEQGEIIEAGTHQELLAKQGLYWNLYRQQEG